MSKRWTFDWMGGSVPPVTCLVAPQPIGTYLVPLLLPCWHPGLGTRCYFNVRPAANDPMTAIP